MIRVMRPSVPMRMNAFGANGGVARAGATALRGGASICQPSSKPPPVAAPAVRHSRRDTRSMSASPLGCGRGLRSVLDGRADAGIRAAAANVARHARVDVPVGGMGLAREQCGSRHDLARLAVAALHDLEIEPGLLDPLATGGRAYAFDRGDVLAAHRADWCD